MKNGECSHRAPQPRYYGRNTHSQ